MILELALGVGVGYLLTKGGYLPNGSPVMTYSASPHVLDGRSLRVTRYKSRSEAMAAGRQISKKVERAIKVIGKPRVKVSEVKGRDGDRYYSPIISYKSRRWQRRRPDKYELRGAVYLHPKVRRMRGKGYNRMEYILP